MVEVLQAVDLFLIEVVHFRRANYLVIVKVNYREPVLERPGSSFVFFRKHEPNEVFVAHFVSLSRFKFPRHLLKYSVNSFAGKSMAFIPREIFLVYQEIMVSVKLPEAAVEYIKMFIGKVLSNFVDVLFVSHLPENSL